MAKEIESEMIGPVRRSDFDDSKKLPTDDWLKKENELYGYLIKNDKEVCDRGGIIGRLARFQINDGYAVYRVESKNPLILQHVPIFDGYRILPATMRGLLLKDLKAQWKFDNTWRKLK